MWPDQVSNPGPLTYESGALPTVLRGPATAENDIMIKFILEISVKMHVYTTMISYHSYMWKQLLTFCYILVVSLDEESNPKQDQLLKKRICSYEQILSCKS